MQCDKLTISFADVAQLVVQLIRNQQVAGPSPAISSKKYGKVRLFVLLQSGTQTKGFALTQKTYFAASVCDIN